MENSSYAEEGMKDAVSAYLDVVNQKEQSLKDICVIDQLQLAVIIKSLGVFNGVTLNPYVLSRQKKRAFMIEGEEILILEHLFHKGILNIVNNNIDAFYYRKGIDYHVEKHITERVTFSINIIEIIEDTELIEKLSNPSTLNLNKEIYRQVALDILTNIELEIFARYLLEYNLYTELDIRHKNSIKEILEHNSIQETQNAIEGAGKFVMSEIMAKRSNVNGSSMYILNVAKKYLGYQTDRNYTSRRIKLRCDSLLEQIFFKNYLYYTGEIYNFKLSYFDQKLFDVTSMYLDV